MDTKPQSCLRSPFRGRMSPFAGASADSRKIFRLGKFIAEYAALLRLVAAKPPENDRDRKIQVNPKP